MFALIVHVEANCFFDTKYRFFKRERHLSLSVAPTAWSALTLTTTEELSEYVAKPTVTKIKVDVLAVEPTKALKGIASGATTGIATDTRVTKLVIALSFLLVFEYFVSFVYLFELCLVTTLFVGMVFDGSLTKRLLDLVS